MRRSSLFWGSILILAGILFLLDNLGLLGGINLGNLLWPLFLIALGLWFLWGTFFRRSPTIERVRVPLEGASQARVHVSHGAGRLRVSAGAGPDVLAEGDFGGGLDLKSQRNGDRLEVEMRVPPQAFPFFGPPGTPLDWTFALNREVLLALDFDTGANEAVFDLRDLQVSELFVKSGASSSDLTLPANAGNTRVRVETGVSSFNIRVPAGVAARIRSRGALSSFHVDSRFPKLGDVYQSPDYETAQNRADIDVQLGVGSVSVA